MGRSIMIIVFAMFAPILVLNAQKPNALEIPPNSSEIWVKCSLADLQAEFLKDEMFCKYQGENQGFVTDVINIGNGTTAMYKAFMVDSITVKVLAFWGLTHSAAAQNKNALIIAGGGDKGIDTGLEKAIYYKSKWKDRPRAAFMLGAKIATAACGEVVYK